MDIVDRIELLCKKRSISIAELERKLDFSNNQIRRFRTSVPGVTKVQKVADYFDVSVDYLLGRENKRGEPKNVEEIEVEEDFAIARRKMNKMTSDERKRALDLWNAAFNLYDDKDNRNEK